ncbi:uncharacterized protein BO95DRAFT_458968 [Aspergillus brunneoviolaceus CBS 621.78]|uniref:Uncharacterized protein n=1 Tax=Aspergillus brunneoviolaceus CBS 621.78 TaxID=1450534 RepID=A0ACD1GML7_9EURO|nr:hypothetical protein BO95DRAFT_458968 [Aspergillus brunneoviolaceus CBS 621.78]RAH50483.1 hypothetical protein BO95DRAFT_458968 [Aspergillus brunneoviolaceus CBS 621.78]
MEDPEDPEKRQITVLAQSAVIALQKCLQVSGSFSHLAEAQLARFNLWATNIGVFARYKASLEYRLRDSPDVQRIIINLLEILALYAGQALRTELEGSSSNNDEARRSEISTKCEATTPGRDISNTTPCYPGFQIQPLKNLSIVPAYQAVEDTITRLHHLSIAIRNAGVRNPYSRITRLIILDEDGNDINQAFESFISQVLKLRHSRLSEALRSRLADAICFRRRRFLYNKPSPKKYQGGFVAPVLPSGRGVYHIPTPPASRKRPSIPDAPLPSPARAPTTRTASTFYPQRFQYPRSSEPSVVSTATPSSHIPRMNEHIPKPPSVASGQKEAQCPYCPFVINIKYLTGTRWIKHFQDDLEPYICLFEDCTSPRELFSSAEQWLAHMKAHPAPSTEWICSMRHASSDRTVMKSAEEFAIHVREMHSGRFTDMQIKKLQIRAARPGPVFPSCPFCDWLEHPDPEKPKVSGGPTPMEEHIADHLFDLALLSLPPIQNNENSDEEVRDSLANISIVSGDRHSALSQNLSGLEFSSYRSPSPANEAMYTSKHSHISPVPSVDALSYQPDSPHPRNSSSPFDQSPRPLPTSDDPNSQNPSRCRWHDCFYSCTWGSQGTLLKHIKDEHVAHLGFRCPLEGCSTSYSLQEDLMHHIKVTHGGLVVDNAEVDPFEVVEELEQKALQTSGQPLICRWDDCPQREPFFSSHSLLFHIDRDHVVPENGDYSGSIRDLDPSLMSAPKNPKDYDAVFNDHFEIEPPRRENSVEELPGQESEVIKCICGLSHDDGQTIYCERCYTWQHIVCYYGDNLFPDEHMCGDCQPRPLNAQRARALQEAQLEAASTATRRQEEENQKARKRRRRKDRDLGETGSDSRAASSPLPRRNEPDAGMVFFPSESAPIRKRRRQVPSAPILMSTDILEKEPPSKKPPGSEHQEL